MVAAHQKTILFVTLALERGGTEQHLAEVVPRLVKKGWSAEIYCLAARGVRAAEVEANGVKVIGPPLDGTPVLSGVFGLVRVVGSALKLGWLMAMQRPYIVHFFLPGPYLVGAPLSILTARPIRIMSRRNLDVYLRGRPVIAAVERHFHRWMTAVAGNSQQICEELKGEGCDPKRVAKIYNGVDIGRFEAGGDRGRRRRQLGISDKAIVGVLVANLIPYKGHADLIEALAGVKDRMPNDWIVLCAGRDDGIEADLKERVRRSGLEGHVRFLGSCTDVADLLMCADFSLLSSHEEGFSNAIIEGMAAGLAMIVTDVGGNTDAVIDGETGIVVPPKAPEQLGEAILRIASDGALRAQYGAAGKLRARSYFSIEQCVDHYQRFYEGLIEGKRVASCL